MNYTDLTNELVSDPLVRGYSGMSDAEATVDLNTEYRETNRTAMSGSEIFNAVDKVEYDALSVGDNARFWDILHLSSVDPFGIEAQIVIDVFGAGSTTVSTLAAMRKTPISRATELGLGSVREGHVQKARE